MSHLFWLNDTAWGAIEPFMPKNQPGARRVDDRRVISGIFHVLKTGGRWCDCPQDYGPHKTIYNRFNRWSRKRFWINLLEALAEAGVSSCIIVDCSPDNSSKNPDLQPGVAAEITRQILAGNPSIIGLMMESNINAGNQPIPPNIDDLQYGVSVTDACIDWDTTERTLLEMHQRLKKK